MKTTPKTHELPPEDTALVDNPAWAKPDEGGNDWASAGTIEEIHIRADAITPVLKEILEIHLVARWAPME